MKTVSEYSWNVRAVLGFSIWTATAPSRTTLSTMGGSLGLLGWRALRQSTRSDFWPFLISPLSASDGGQGWFSWRKNSSRFPSRFWQAIYSRENKEQSFFNWTTFDLSFDWTFSSELWNSTNLFLGIGSEMGIVLCLSLHSTYDVYCSWPILRTFFTASTTPSLIMSLVSTARRSFPSSSKGFPNSSKLSVTDWTSLQNAAWWLYDCSWCFRLSADLDDVVFSNSDTILAISGPEIIQRFNALGFSVSPTAPPSPFTTTFSC